MTFFFSLNNKKQDSLFFNKEKGCYRSILSVNFISKIQLKWLKKLICGHPVEDFSCHPHFRKQEYFFWPCKFQLDYYPSDKVVSSVIKWMHDCVAPPGTIFLNYHLPDIIHLITCCRCTSLCCWNSTKIEWKIQLT